MNMQQMMDAAGLDTVPASDEELADMLKKCMHGLDMILGDKPLDILSSS